MARGMMLTREQVESLHSYYNMKRKKNITFTDKVILPFKDEFDDVDSIQEEIGDEAAEEITQEDYSIYLQRKM